MDITRFYRVSKGFYWVLLGFTRFCWVSMGLDGFEWVLPSFTEFLLGLMGVDLSLYLLVLPSFLLGFYWV